MDRVADTLLDRVSQELVERRRLPEATYRLQFNAGFTFRDACRLVPYLHDLGITHCYASPYLKARPGSLHGYDITDHRVLNPEIGTTQDYDAWVDALRGRGMGQILDTVPNHMGVVGNENPWWNDVLENGPASPYAGYFDIAWYASPRPELLGRVLLPILGNPYGKALESQEIHLEYAAGAFTICYFDNRFPVDPCTYGSILSHRLEQLESRLGKEDPGFIEYQSILTAVKHLPSTTTTDLARVAERQREKDVIKRRLGTLTQESAAVNEFVAENVALFNGRAGQRHTFDLLDELLNNQPYRLCDWRVASDEINYRRFFDINDLAALNMEKEEVFTATHELILPLLCEGKIMGLRIDHADGLYDPKQYLQRLQQSFVLGCARQLFQNSPEYQDASWDHVEASLRERIGPYLQERAASGQWPLYVVVEKILGSSETLPRDWPTYGTSGYDFLNLLNGLFVAADNADLFTEIYHSWILEDIPFAEVVYQNKFLILQTSLSSELHMLAYQLDRLAQKDRWSRDLTLHSLRHALREVIACFPVYRSYLTGEAASDSDRKVVQIAVKRARSRNPALSPAYFRFIADMLLGTREAGRAEDQEERRQFVGKFQQVSGPVMAKGLEDTAFYVYNRLLSLNEVGGDPGRFGVAPIALHRLFQQRQASWPWALSCTSTHDTKRSEDVRARLNALSEMPDLWRECLKRWSKLNDPQRVMVDEVTVPDANEEYMLYQTLVGAWPLEQLDAEEYSVFVRRIQDFMRKAIHEAKVHTSWINPNPDYDAAVHEFIGRILDPDSNQTFLDDLRTFQKRVSHFGMLYSLGQVLLKITAPGVPDLYQGTECWDFSLVDPDNRRPVDYERRQRLLQELLARTAATAGWPELLRELLASREDGRIKLFITAQALRYRRQHPGLFAEGDYLPVEVAGARQEQVFAFVRRRDTHWALVVVPRLLVRTGLADTDLPLGKSFWQDTRLLFPGIPGGARLRNPFTNEELSFAASPAPAWLSVADLLAHCPVALLGTP